MSRSFCSYLGQRFRNSHRAAHPQTWLQRILLPVVAICGTASPLQAQDPLPCPHEVGHALSASETAGVVEAHRAWLKDPTRGARAALCNVAFVEGDLSGLDLQQANFRNANLRGVDLQGSQLTLADFTGATLKDANLQETDLTVATLIGVDLRGASLFGAGAFGADFRDADLSRASMVGVDLRGSDLAGATLAGANLRESDLREANLRAADLSDADLQMSDLSLAAMAGADLTRADLQDANLSGANLRQADLSSADMRNADLRRSDLTWAELKDADLGNAKFAQVRLYGARYAPISAPYQGSLGGIKGLKEVRLYQGDQSGLSLLRAQLRNAGLRELEREATFALERWRTQNAHPIERSWRLILFEWTAGYGLYHSRPLKILLASILVFGVAYLVPLAGFTSAGIYRVWPPTQDRIEQLDNDQPERLAIKRPSILGYALYFSILSACHIGWRRTLSLETWITNIQPREFTLRATGWVRTLSGFQALLSFYLIVMWVLSYFGRPFG